jgi:hypothetical protein
MLPYGWLCQHEPWMLLAGSANRRVSQGGREATYSDAIVAISSVQEQAMLSSEAPIEYPHVPLIVAGQSIGELTPDLLIRATQTLQTIVSGNSIVSQDREPEDTSHVLAAPELQALPSDNRFGSFQLSDILQAIIQSEYAHIGLGVGRLRRIVPMSRVEAATVLCWLDLAGLIEPARNPHSPWRDPRRLCITDLSEILAKLEATPLPSTSERMAAFPKNNSGI